MTIPSTISQTSLDRASKYIGKLSGNPIAAEDGSGNFTNDQIILRKLGRLAGSYIEKETHGSMQKTADSGQATGPITITAENLEGLKQDHLARLDILQAFKEKLGLMPSEQQRQVAEKLSAVCLYDATNIPRPANEFDNFLVVVSRDGRSLYVQCLDTDAHTTTSIDPDMETDKLAVLLLDKLIALGLEITDEMRERAELLLVSIRQNIAEANEKADRQLASWAR